MKKIVDILISTRTMAVLLVVYAVAMAYATFVENDYGTPAAKAYIYEAKWFELVMLLLIINFIGNIERYRLWRREKWSVLAFHLAFAFIFIGGAITRYISFEGIMLIREKEMSNEIISDKSFFKIQIEENGDRLNYRDIPFLFASDKPLIAKLIPHRFKAIYDFNDKKISVAQVDFIQRKKDSLIADKNGEEYLHFVVAGEAGRENYYLKSGEAKNISGMLVSFNRAIDGAVEFKKEGADLYIKTPVDASYLTMATQQTTEMKKDEAQPLALKSLYTIANLRIVVPDGLKRGNLTSFEGDKTKEQHLPDVLKLEVKGPRTTQQVELLVEKGNPNLFKQINLDGMNIMLGVGPKVYTTPFHLRLDDFVMETYPGSTSPSAYESHIQIVDEGKETPYRIYMNNVLNYKGYRFFQSGFDPDRQGTRLSVNHDWWGTLITYIGYTVLFLGMFVSFFWKGSHFWNLSATLKKMSANKSLVIALLFLPFGFNALAQGNSTASASSIQKIKYISPDQIIAKTNISKAHADKFGYLLVQNFEGRIVPVNTQALEVLRKLYKRDKFRGSEGQSLDANQWFLAINTDTESWTMVPLIKVGTKGGELLKTKTKANDEGYTSLMNLFPVNPQTGKLTYILEEDFNTAFAKKPSEQSNYDKEVISVNERVQIFNEFFSGQFVRIVPVKNDPNHTWNSWLNSNFEPDEEAQKILGPYFYSVIQAQKSGNWAAADAELKKLSEYQQTWGKSVVPSKNKVEVEVFMNKVNINFVLMIFYSVIGGLLTLLGFIELFKPNKILNKAIKTLIAIGCIGYVLQFFGLVGRWYISGHAPWSNGYEAIVFISWVGISAGLFLYKNSNALIPASGFMVAVLMMGFAHGGSALDPQITPLVPVLKSYWLIIHVAIITASYGFFGLSFVISVICLLFYILAGKDLFKYHNNRSIKELTIVSEMSLTIGLFALTMGTFIGGIWANESWGRYWSWDPKETWAFISVMVYALVIHLRLVPGLRGRWLFHSASMFAISSVIMTYFGVNYYLSGLHSYAAGDPVPVPVWVYIGSGVMLLLSVLSFFKVKRLENKK